MIDLSFSRIQSFQRCPWLYHLVFDEGMRGGKTGSMSFGTSLHRTLGAFLDDENSEKTLERLLEIYDQAWVNEGYKSIEQTLDTYSKGKDILRNFLIDHQNNKSQKIETEREFRIEINSDLTLIGIIDRLDLSPAGIYEIIEYKSNQEGWSDQKINQDLQMTLYAYAMKKELKINNPRLKYYFLSSHTWVETSRSDDQYLELETLIQKTANQIKNKIFTPNISYCSFCEIGKRCEYYKESK
ncbi:MAG: RecB family exonuclease [Elusimicrobiota bacterium]